MIVNETTKANAQAVLDYITMHPERHDQSNWVGDGSNRYFFLYQSDNKVFTEDNICGTTMCIAGTTILLTEGVDGINNVHLGFMGYGPYKTWSRAAGEHLGLMTVDESDALFFEMDNNNAIDLLKTIAAGDANKFHELAATFRNDF